MINETKDMECLTETPSSAAPSIAALRREYRKAFRMWKLTRLRGWEKAVRRLNDAIMARARPVQQ